MYVVSCLMRPEMQIESAFLFDLQLWHIDIVMVLQQDIIAG
jgi:hypothetical protein